jgi:hypothetical protein
MSNQRLAARIALNEGLRNSGRGRDVSSRKVKFNDPSDGKISDSNEIAARNRSECKYKFQGANIHTIGLDLS